MKRAYGNVDESLGDFDERDLLDFAEEAGFETISLQLEAEIAPGTWFTSWDAFLKSSGNPLIPTQKKRSTAR